MQYLDLPIKLPIREISLETRMSDIKVCVVGLTCLLLCLQVSAHSGGLNAQGCHGGSRPYHCHRAPSEMVGNRLRCDLGSRSKDCVGIGSSSAANKSTVPKNPSIKETETNTQYAPDFSSLPDDIDPTIVRGIQTRLKLIGLYEGSVDGVFGPKTALAIDLFKIKNGIPIGEYFDAGTLQALGIFEG